MRCTLKARSFAAAGLVATWWITVNLSWVIVGERELTGAQLAPLANLVPGIAITALLISLYGKAVRLLFVLSGAALIALGTWILATNWSEQPAVITILEELSGVLNADQHAAGVYVGQLTASYLSGVLAVIAGALILIFGLRRPGLSVRPERERVEDNRSLWDEQT